MDEETSLPDMALGEASGFAVYFWTAVGGLVLYFLVFRRAANAVAGARGAAAAAPSGGGRAAEGAAAAREAWLARAAQQQPQTAPAEEEERPAPAGESVSAPTAPAAAVAAEAAMKRAAETVALKAAAAPVAPAPAEEKEEEEEEEEEASPPPATADPTAAVPSDDDEEAWLVRLIYRVCYEDEAGRDAAATDAPPSLLLLAQEVLRDDARGVVAVPGLREVAEYEGGLGRIDLDEAFELDVPQDLGYLAACCHWCEVAEAPRLSIRPALLALLRERHRAFLARRAVRTLNAAGPEQVAALVRGVPLAHFHALFRGVCADAATGWAATEALATDAEHSVLRALVQAGGLPVAVTGRHGNTAADAAQRLLFLLRLRAGFARRLTALLFAQGVAGADVIPIRQCFAAMAAQTPTRRDLDDVLVGVKKYPQVHDHEITATFAPLRGGIVAAVDGTAAVVRELLRTPPAGSDLDAHRAAVLNWMADNLARFAERITFDASSLANPNSLGSYMGAQQVPAQRVLAGEVAAMNWCLLALGMAGPACAHGGKAVTALFEDTGARRNFSSGMFHHAMAALRIAVIPSVRIYRKLRERYHKALQSVPGFPERWGHDLPLPPYVFENAKAVDLHRVVLLHPELLQRIVAVGLTFCEIVRREGGVRDAAAAAVASEPAAQARPLRTLWPHDPTAPPEASPLPKGLQEEAEDAGAAAAAAAAIPRTIDNFGWVWAAEEGLRDVLDIFEFIAGEARDQLTSVADGFSAMLTHLIDACTTAPPPQEDPEAHRRLADMLHSSVFIKARLVMLLGMLRPTASKASDRGDYGNVWNATQYAYAESATSSFTMLQNLPALARLPRLLFQVYGRFERSEGFDIAIDEHLMAAAKAQSLGLINALLVNERFKRGLHAELDGTDEAGDDVAYFMTALTSEAIHNLDDAFGRLTMVRDAEVRAGGRNPTGVEKLKLEHQLQSAKGFMGAANSTLKTLQMLLDPLHEEKGAAHLPRCLLAPNVVRTLAHFLVYFTNKLHSPACDALKDLHKPKDAGYDRTGILEMLVNMLVLLDSHPTIVAAVVAHDDFALGPFKQAREDVVRLSLGGLRFANGMGKCVAALEAAVAAGAASTPGTGVDVTWAPQGGMLVVDDDMFVEALEDLQNDQVDLSGGGAYRSHSMHREIADMAHGAVSKEKRKALMRELKLSRELPLHPSASVFTAFDESRMDVCRFIVSGPEGTPYAHGLFVFDCVFQSNYPTVPPTVALRTTDQGTIRFSPHLYESGKVCLSLLNTWHGDNAAQKWVPGASSLYQVALSIQSAILVPNPYFGEPGHEAFEGTSDGAAYSRRYNEERQLATLRAAVLGNLQDPAPGCEEVVRKYMTLMRDRILLTATEWMRAASEEFRPKFAAVINKLADAFAGLEGDTCTAWTD